MNNNDIPPKYKMDAFNCPDCQAYAHQKLFNLSKITNSTKSSIEYQGEVKNLEICLYLRRFNYSLWIKEKMNSL